MMNNLAKCTMLIWSATIFEESERQLNEDLQLKFEAIQQMSEQDQLTIKSLLEGMILKHQAKQMLGH